MCRRLFLISHFLGSACWLYTGIAARMSRDPRRRGGCCAEASYGNMDFRISDRKAAVRAGGMYAKIRSFTSWLIWICAELGSSFLQLWWICQAQQVCKLPACLPDLQHLCTRTVYCFSRVLKPA